MSLERFFKDKEAVYQKECARCVMEQLEFNLQAALDYSDKDECNDIIEIIDSRSDADLKLINWEKKGIKGWVMHRYVYMKIGRLKFRSIRFMKKRWKAMSINSEVSLN